MFSLGMAAVKRETLTLSYLADERFGSDDLLEVGEETRSKAGDGEQCR